MFQEQGIVTSIYQVYTDVWQITIQSDRGPDVTFRMRNSECYVSPNDRICVYINRSMYGSIPYAYGVYNETRGIDVL